MFKEITCIGCPMGCRLTCEVEESQVKSVEGHTCKIGERYAHEELTCPTRMVTSLMKAEGGKVPLSVKTSKPIEKARIVDCLKAIEETTVMLPVHIGDVLIKGVCGTDVDIVATKELY